MKFQNTENKKILKPSRVGEKKCQKKKKKKGFIFKLGGK